VLRACEGLDDDHRCTAVSAHEGGLNRAGDVVLAVTAGKLVYWLMQELACGGDVVPAAGVGEQPVMSDAMKTRGQHVQQEAAHELPGRQSHGLVSRPAVCSVVLPAEGDATILQGHEPGVGDRHPMGVAR